jgi:hypothetical protein
MFQSLNKSLNGKMCVADCWARDHRALFPYPDCHRCVSCVAHVPFRWGLKFRKNPRAETAPHCAAYEFRPPAHVEAWQEAVEV